VSLALQRYIEPLDVTELQFLERKEGKERKQYYKVYRILMFFSFLIPFIAAWYRAYDGAPNAFSIPKFFAGTSTLLFLSTFSTYASYRLNLRKIQLDLKHGTKTIETHRITRKMFVPTKNTYHFYIDSKVKLSIEVSDKDFVRLREGDEISIEYSTHAKQYFGYF
jgi:hypothetical protein